MLLKKILGRNANYLKEYIKEVSYLNRYEGRRDGTGDNFF